MQPQESRLVAGAGYLWLADSADGRVYRVDPTTRKISRSRYIRAQSMVFGDGRLWVLDTLCGKIAGLDPGTGHSLPTTTVPGNLSKVWPWEADTCGSRTPQNVDPADPRGPWVEGLDLHLARPDGDEPDAIAYDGDGW